MLLVFYSLFFLGKLRPSSLLKTSSPVQHHYALSQVRTPRDNYSSNHALYAKPKQGSIVDSYRSVSINCSKCRTRLFRYKKKNGTKSNLIKCYLERISEDSAGLLSSSSAARDGNENENSDTQHESWKCPNCQTQFARSAMIHGRPALKMIGGKVRMTKK